MNQTQLILEQTVYAQKGEEVYYVYPIMPSKEKLAKLCLVDDNLEEVGEPFKVEIYGDLLEFYTLLDIDGEELWNPEDHAIEESVVFKKRKIR